MVRNHGNRKLPKDQVVGHLPNGRTSWLINGGDPITTEPSPGMIFQVQHIKWNSMRLAVGMFSFIFERLFWGGELIF